MAWMHRERGTRREVVDIPRYRSGVGDGDDRPGWICPLIRGLRLADGAGRIRGIGKQAHRVYCTERLRMAGVISAAGGCK